MATRNFTVEIPRDSRGASIPGCFLVIWTGLTQATADDGKPYVCPDKADKCIQVTGTFGVGGNCRFEGSNDQVYDASGTLVAGTYGTLVDPQGNALDVTATKLEQVLENPLAVRPRITAGDGTTSITVKMLIRAAKLIG